MASVRCSLTPIKEDYTSTQYDCVWFLLKTYVSPLALSDNFVGKNIGSKSAITKPKWDDEHPLYIYV